MAIEARGIPPRTQQPQQRPTTGLTPIPERERSQACELAEQNAALRRRVEELERTAVRNAETERALEKVKKELEGVKKRLEEEKTRGSQKAGGEIREEIGVDPAHAEIERVKEELAGEKTRIEEKQREIEEVRRADAERKRAAETREAELAAKIAKRNLRMVQVSV